VGSPIEGFGWEHWDNKLGVTMRIIRFIVAAVVFAPTAALASIVVPITYVGSMMGGDTICSAQAVAVANNVNQGEEFERNDAKARAEAESRCDVANNIMRNVTDALNENFNDNFNENFSEDLNHSFKRNLNKNIGRMMGF
jgi:hypothetical protein